MYEIMFVIVDDSAHIYGINCYANMNFKGYGILVHVFVMDTTNFLKVWLKIFCLCLCLYTENTKGAVQVISGTSQLRNVKVW